VAAGEFDGSVEVVRGRLDERSEREILAFWAANGALRGQAAQQRLPQVVCVARTPDGAIAGVNSVYDDNVFEIANRRFWVYRSFLLPQAKGAWMEMIRSAFRALESEFDPDSPGPIGLCIPIADRAEMRLYPEAEWEDPRIIYAGFDSDGRQLRIGYFEGARISG
jgi:hypothetical protein